VQVVRRIERRDVIVSIRIEGDPAPVFSRRRDQLARWNEILDREFPDLKPASDF